jgi:hypothetical protein
MDTDKIRLVTEKPLQFLRGSAKRDQITTAGILEREHASLKRILWGKAAQNYGPSLMPLFIISLRTDPGLVPRQPNDPLPHEPKNAKTG